MGFQPGHHAGTFTEVKGEVATSIKCSKVFVLGPNEILFNTISHNPLPLAVVYQSPMINTKRDSIETSSFPIVTKSCQKRSYEIGTCSYNPYTKHNDEHDNRFY